MNKTKSIYIMISQTNTRFAYLVRKLGRTHYNHAAVSLDADLKQLYAFARPRHSAVLLARLVRENIYRYTLGKATNVNVVIFKVDISEAQYHWVKDTISGIYQDEEYMYNLLSVLSYPISSGFSTYKAFSCIEFAMFILKALSCEVNRPLYHYKPDDLLDLLKEQIWYQGNLLDYKTDDAPDTDYFSPMNLRLLLDSLFALKCLFMRTFFVKKTKNRSRS